MIAHIEIIFSLPEPERFRQDWAYGLYGLLCRRMPPELATQLHEQTLTPIRQSVHPGPQRGQITWRVDLFGEELQSLADILERMEYAELEKSPDRLAVVGCEKTLIPSAHSFIEQAQAATGGRRARFFFQAPTGFKSAGQYALFPSAELIAKSLLQRWNMLMPEISLVDADAEQMLVSGLQIKQYQLQSAVYPIKGQSIGGFQGSLTIQAKLPEPMLELWKLLVLFAPYSGVGIKTALGMGAVRTELLP